MFQNQNTPRTCVLIPTYNHAASLAQVVSAVLNYCPHVIVVNDGSTDNTLNILQQFDNKIDIIDYTPNKGKGHALKRGFEHALKRGFEHVITIDSDGQHLASDIPALLATSEQHPHALIVGSRRMDHENMPQGNRFANRFSNFWFTVQTAHRLPDTQTGYRLYPLERMHGLRPTFDRYEAELEMLVRAAWRGIELIPVGVNVVYPPKGERISHFKPTADFVRISLLNTALCVLAAVYGYPRMALHRLFKRK